MLFGLEMMYGALQGAMANAAEGLRRGVENVEGVEVLVVGKMGITPLQISLEKLGMKARVDS